MARHDFWAGQPGDESELARAIAAAVSQSREVWRELSIGVNRVTTVLRASTAGGDDVSGADKDDAMLLQKARELVDSVSQELQGLVDRQDRAINTFNIVLFGRTGTGKSSLVEALTSGNGKSISPGESDWTTKVAITEWGACRVYDTPGIAGWGRTMKTSSLEDRAREAIVAADVVLLCFDSQSQQADEFRKAAQWIAAYGKPVIAILNNRNRLWRYPARVPLRAQRIESSQTVAEHASNIRDELARIGIRDAPIVALNGMRAVFARASEPYRGPEEHKKSMLAQRKEVGTARLLEWSNLPALERLVVTAIRADAVQLRLGMLLRQVRAALELAGEQLKEQLREPSLEVVQEVERGLERVLSLLGLPDEHGADDNDRAYREFRDDLVRLEQLRGGRFQVSTTGKASLHAVNLISAKFGPLRADAHRRSDELIGDAMAARRDVAGEEFAERVYDMPAIEAAIEQVRAQFADHVNQQAGLVVEDARADINWVTEHSTVGGSAGRGLAWAGRYGGLASRGMGAAVTAMITAAALNAWNPVGWMLAAGAAAGALIGIVGRWLSRRAAREAERRREQALGQSRANARSAVNATFEAVQAELAKQLTEELRTEITGRARTAVRRALLLRKIATHAEECRAEIDRFRATLRETGNPVAVLRRAVAACEATASLGTRGPAALWLGESWCDEGLADSGTESSRRSARMPEPQYTRRLRLDLQTGLAAAAATPVPGAGQEWLAWAQERLATDPAAAKVLRESAALSRAAAPRVLICGDYDTGKSSFIRRLLVDAGQPVPEGLTISARPETSAMREYDWRGCTLVDVPGFQSGHPEHTAAARAAVADAALVIYLFNPNLVVGDQDDLSFVLAGDPQREIIGKLERTVCVVNRSDAFGPDPMDDPEGFTRLAERKEAELADALAALPALAREGKAVVRSRIVCMASSPYDLRITAREHADEFRAWDGFQEFERDMEKVRPALEGNGRDVTALHGGLARLGALAAQVADAQAGLREQAEQLAQLTEDATTQAVTGRLIVAERTEAVRHITDDFLNGMLSKAWSTPVEGIRSAIARRLSDWPKDTEFRQYLSEWLVATNDQIKDWQLETQSRLGARTGMPQFKASMPDANDPGAGPEAQRVADALRRAERAWKIKDTTDLTTSMGYALEFADAQSVYDWGLELGHVFSAAEAVQIATDIADFGVDLVGVGFVIDLFRISRSLRHEWARNEEQQELVRSLREDGRNYADAVALGTRGHKGALSGVQAACAELDNLVSALKGQREALSAEDDAITTRLADYRDVIAEAHARLATGDAQEVDGDAE